MYMERGNSMTILDVIKGRRTIKKFKADPIPEEKILKWFEAASVAPNHRMTEPWEILFAGPATRREINHKTDFGGAPVVFAVVSRKGKSTLETEENKMATACFMQNFMLAAWEEGVGCFWSSVGFSPKNLMILSVGEERELIGVFGMGYPEEIPARKDRKPVSEKITHLP